jgi:prepilin-type N-terminal cleavage/methylation domain-containing protein
MKQCLVRSGKRLPQPRGFTLVEMLVSVGLVLLMMTMFASIFQIATESISKQRSVSENDQKVRSLSNIIRSDIQHRTFRYPLPFYPGEDSTTSPTRFGNRGGYIYISTNDPTSGLDDLLQFTVDSNISTENPDTTPFVGHSSRLKDLKDSPIYSGVNDPKRSDLTISPNQPDADDGSLALDGKSVSTAAEIAYFVRGGNFYRRVVLLREPIGVAGETLGPQPSSTTGYNLLSAIDEINFAMPTPDPTSRFQLHDGTLTNDFWQHFDLAAFANFQPGVPQHAAILGLASLNNEGISAGAVGESLGNPVFRFGFNGRLPVSGFRGASREHTDISGTAFIGRYTQAETSASNFNWPQFLSEVPGTPGVALWSSNLASPGNPMDMENTVTLDPQSFRVSEFSEASGTGRGGPRRMEDLLLSGVQELKFEIWDDRLNRFVNPGHTEVDALLPTPIEGDYHAARRLNADAGPFGNNPTGATLNHTFDTWHPEAFVDLNADGNRDLSSAPGSTAPRTTPPPFIPYSFYPPLAPSGPSPVTSPGPFGTYWQPNHPYPLPVPTDPPEIVFSPWIDDASPGPDGIFQYGECEFSIGYRLVVGGTSGATAPAFPKRPGIRIVDGTCQWESFDNRRPLQAIRMTVRFMDQKSQSVRQLSLILPLLEHAKP